LLTINIPTYNRLDKLKQNLFLLDQELKKNLHAQIKVQVFDNNSTNYNSEEEATRLKTLYPYLSIKKNSANLGLSGNILKCLENVDTEWVWILADDDFILPGALDRILQLLDTDSNLVYINFNTDLVNRKSEFKTVGVEEFVRSIDSFYNLLFVSSGIYRVRTYIPFLKFGYLYNYTLAPHLSVLFTSIDNSSVCLFTSNQILSRNDVANNVEERWSDIPLQLSLMCLLELPLNLSSKSFSLLAKSIETHIKSPSYNFKVLLWYKEFDDHLLQLQYVYNQLFLRSFHHKKKINYWMQYLFYSVIIKLNMIPLVRLLYKKIGKNTPQFSRFKRV
jgi:glycosyltransferase involved in cell wall biosynthesis